MTPKQKLDEQISCLMAVHYIALEAAALMETRLEFMMSATDSNFSHEAKMYYNRMRNALGTIKTCLDYFEAGIIPSLVTNDGRTDLQSTQEALLSDANAVVRTLCRMYNDQSKNSKINEDIINSFVMK